MFLEDRGVTICVFTPPPPILCGTEQGSIGIHWSVHYLIFGERSNHRYIYIDSKVGDNIANLNLITSLRALITPILQMRKVRGRH